MWFPVALCRDLPPGATRAAVIDGAARVIWRAENGQVQVWEDRCPHRGMRLSFGFVRGNSLNCLYHGWEYAAGSPCVRIPAHPDLEVPNTIKATSFAAAEAGGMIWTRNEGDGAMLDVPDATPVASLAVAAPVEAIKGLCAAVEQWRAQVFAADLAGSVLTIGWHETGSGTTMLHATVPVGSDPAAALRELRGLRDRAESRVAA